MSGLAAQVRKRLSPGGVPHSPRCPPSRARRLYTRGLLLLACAVAGAAVPELRPVVALALWLTVLATEMRRGEESRERVVSAVAAALLVWAPAPLLLAAGLPGVWLLPLGVAAYAVAPPAVAAVTALLAVSLIAELPAVSLQTSAALLTLHAVLLPVVLRVEHGYRRARRSAQLDPLTGIGNRRALYPRLEACRALAHRQGAAASMIMLDVDHFKTVNDRHGHMIGDRVLRRIVRLSTDRLRGRDRLFRFGGEELVAVLPHTHAAGGYRLAEALRTEIADGTARHAMPVTVSAGVAELVVGESAEAWLARADAALYRAKRAGRNRTRIASLCPVRRTLVPYPRAGGPPSS